MSSLAPVLMDICDGMLYLHARHIVHGGRDCARRWELCKEVGVEEPARGGEVGACCVWMLATVSTGGERENQYITCLARLKNQHDGGKRGGGGRGGGRG